MRIFPFKKANLRISRTKKLVTVYLFIIGLYLIKQTSKFFEEKEITFFRRNFPLKYSIKLRLGLNRGVAAVKFLVGQKKIAKKGSIFFPIWAKNSFELDK